MAPTDNNDTGRVTQRDLYEALADFRKENKEDMASMKKEVLDALAAVVAEFRGYREDHAQVHAELERKGTEALQADRAEALAAATRLAERKAYTSILFFIGRNWKTILIGAAVIAALLGFDASDFVQHLQNLFANI